MSKALHGLMSEWLLNGSIRKEIWMLRSAHTSDKDNWFVSGELVSHLVPRGLQDAEDLLEKVSTS